MGIGLMPDIPDQPVVRRIEYMVKGYGELDHAKPRAEVASSDRNRVDGLLAKFCRELGQLVILKRAQILGRLDAIKQRRRIFGAHLTWLRLRGSMRRITAKHLYRPAA